jgi:nucleotide-binding universal stress UspA family protein
MKAVEVAAGFARQNDGTVILLHVIPAFPISPGQLDDETGGLPTHTIAEDGARAKLEEIARKHLQGVENQLLLHLGNPAAGILNAAADLVADVIVMATHGLLSGVFREHRRGGAPRGSVPGAHCSLFNAQVQSYFPRAIYRYAVKRSVAVPRNYSELSGEDVHNYSMAHCSQQFSSVV